MKRLSYAFTTTVEFSAPVHDHAFVLRCLPATREGQQAHGKLELDPPTTFTVQEDSFGNLLACGRIDEEHASFTYRASGEAIVEVPRFEDWLCGLEAGTGKAAAGATDTATPPAPHAAHPLFRYPSQLACADEAIVAFACSAGCTPEHAPHPARLRDAALRAEALMHALHERMAYTPGATDVHTTAAQAFAQGRGVCQDFAHILVAALRNWGLPARYACGITEGEGATHAWAQAYIGGRWIGLDPTRDKLTDEGYLVVAVGRDWADCPVERGVFIGAADQTQTVFMEVMDQ